MEKEWGCKGVFLGENRRGGCVTVVACCNPQVQKKKANSRNPAVACDSSPSTFLRIECDSSAHLLIESSLPLACPGEGARKS